MKNLIITIAIAILFAMLNSFQLELNQTMWEAIANSG